MNNKKPGKGTINRTKLDIVIVLLSVSTGHGDKTLNRIAIGDIYRIIRLKNGIKSNRPIRDQIEFLIAQGIAEYTDNKKNVRIKATSGLAMRLFSLLEETPDEAFPYYKWEDEFLYRGAYQMRFIGDLFKTAKGARPDLSYTRETIFTAVFMNFSSVTNSIDHAFLKDTGRDMLFQMLFQLAKEGTTKPVGGYSNFLPDLIENLHINKDELAADEEGIRISAIKYFSGEIRKSPDLFSIIHNIFFPESEREEIIACLRRSPAAMRTILNYKKFSAAKLYNMSLFAIFNGMSTDDIINEVLWFHGEGKKSIIVLRGVLEIAGYFEKNEIDRFCDALEKKFHDKRDVQEFEAVRLELSIKGTVRYNTARKFNGHDLKSPMLILLSAYQHMDYTDGVYSTREPPFYQITFTSPQSAYSLNDIDDLFKSNRR